MLNANARSRRCLRRASVVFVSTRGWLLPPDFTEGLHPHDMGHQKATALRTATIARLTGETPRLPG
jgi:hypothetical protein